jgi:hypothetical protein
MIAITEQLVKHPADVCPPILTRLNIAEGPGPREYLTEHEVAYAMAANLDDVRCWINSGDLCAVNVARSATSGRPRWSISRDELNRFTATRLSPQPITTSS